jgi:hypothetical protein
MDGRSRAPVEFCTGTTSDLMAYEAQVKMRRGRGSRWLQRVAVAALVVVSGCTSSTPAPGPTRAAPSQPEVSATRSATLSPPVVAANLDTAPAVCPGPHPRLGAASSAYGKVAGSGPLRGGIYAELNTRANAFHATDAPRTDFGWRIKILWLVRPDQAQPLMIQGSGSSSEGPVLFALPENDPTKTFQLDPADAGVPLEKGHWLEYPSYAYFPRAGCYRLSARWEGGGWDLGFGFGR